MFQKNGMRWRVLAVENKQMVRLWQGIHAYKVAKNNLPPDAKIVGCQLNLKTKDIELVIESMAYRPVAEGERLPYVETPVAVDLLDKLQV